MLSLISLRTVINVLVGIYTCSAYISDTRRDEEPRRISRSSMTSIVPISVTMHSTAPSKNDSFLIPEVNEARGGTAEKFVATMTDALLHTNVVDGFKVSEPLLHGVINSIETATGRVRNELIRVKNLFEQNDWRVKLEETDVSWNDELIRNYVFCHCLGSGESPMYIFRYMKIRLPYSPNDVQSIDPKLLWWFEYIILYRLVEKSTAKDAATSDTASSHNGFGNKELFSFLVSEYDLQTGGMEMSSAVEKLDSQHRQVVSLIEMLRQSHDMTIRKLAEQMQKYLVTRLDTKELVLQTWLKYLITPSDIFHILDVKIELGPVGDEDVLTLWLRYIEMYWDLWRPDYDDNPFKYDSFLALLKEKFSDKTAEMLLTDAHYQILNKNVEFGFGNHLKNLHAMWYRWYNFSKGYKPQDVFLRVFSSGDFTPKSPDVMQCIAYIDHYRSQETFNDEEIFNMLTTGMLVYISDPSTLIKVAGMTPTKYWDIFLSHGAYDEALLLRWHEFDTLYSKQNEEYKPSKEDVIKRDVPTRFQAGGLETLKQDSVAAVHTNQLQQKGPPARKKLRRNP
ncbi:hypothetical protein Plhal304r1_c016g0058841 [Plasmopara halstedii]